MVFEGGGQSRNATFVFFKSVFSEESRKIGLYTNHLILHMWSILWLNCMKTSRR